MASMPHLPHPSLDLAALVVSLAGAVLARWRIRVERRRFRRLRRRRVALARELARVRRIARRAGAVARCDRALLEARERGPAWPELLESIAAVLRCPALSVVVAEREDAPAQAHDHWKGSDADAPRVLPVGAAQLLRAAAGDAAPCAILVEPLRRAGARAFQLLPLVRRGRCIGLLCVGLAPQAYAGETDAGAATELAGRLAQALGGRGPAPVQGRPESGQDLTGTGLQRALQQQEFMLHYQPIVGAGTREVCAVEALLRWPRGRELAPLEAAEFLPVAEKSGFIVDLGDWVLRSACAQFDAWRREGLLLDFVAVNISPRQLRTGGFAASVLATLRAFDMRPAQLQLEFPATLLATGTPPPVLVELARRGVRLALDDCRAPFDPQPLLALLPLAAFKLDSTAVAVLPGDPAQRDYLRSLVACARSAGCRLVAEGVESEEQLEYLEHAGCDAMQGFLLAPPLPAEAVAGVVRDVAAAPRLVA